MSSEKCLCRSPTPVLKLGYLDEFLGNSIIEFVNSLYNLITNFLSDIGNLGKIVDDNVLSKS